MPICFSFLGFSASTEKEQMTLWSAHNSRWGSTSQRLNQRARPLAHLVQYAAPRSTLCLRTHTQWPVWKEKTRQSVDTCFRFKFLQVCSRKLTAGRRLFLALHQEHLVTHIERTMQKDIRDSEINTKYWWINKLEWIVNKLQSFFTIGLFCQKQTYCVL